MDEVIKTYRLSQDQVFAGLLKYVKDMNSNKFDERQIVFLSDYHVAIDSEFQKKVDKLNNKKITMKEMYEALNSSVYQINICDDYIGCIERVGRNNWRSYKLLSYRYAE